MIQGGTRGEVLDGQRRGEVGMRGGERGEGDRGRTAAAHDVMSIPTLILFQDGVEKKRIVGAAPKHKLMDDLAEYVSA